MAQESASPWRAFDLLRASMRASSPSAAHFVQTFVPNGFVNGEEEAGEIAFSLPRCLRWDYGEPFPKSFLLCDETAYYWNPGEPSGYRYAIGDEEAPGLDFFLLTTDDLRLRYHASARRTSKGQLHVSLIPVSPTDEVVSLEVLIDSARDRVISLGYEDAQGNRTRFELSNYRKGARFGSFTPPADIVWEDP